MVKKLRIRESADSSWQDHLPRDVFNRLSECRTRKDDIVPLAVAYYQYKLKGRGGSWTPEDALIAIWEWVDCNGQNMDFTKDEYNDMLFDINRLCGFNTLPYDESYKGRKKFKEARYSDVVPYENRKYWYFTTHGIGPGTIPPGVHLLDVVEGQNKKGTWGDYICLDAILNTSELRQYDLIELAPDNVNERLMFRHTYEEVMKKIENREEIETNFSSHAFLPNYNKTKKFPVYIIYAEYRDVAEDYSSHDYQWVLAGYTDNGVIFLTADEINEKCDLSPYMDGEVITNLEGMIQAFPEEFNIDDVIAEQY